MENRDDEQNPLLGNVNVNGNQRERERNKQIGSYGLLFTILMIIVGIVAVFMISTPTSCATMDIVIPIHPSDFSVAFDQEGIISLLQNIRPNFQNVYFLASNETRDKAFALESYNKILVPFYSPRQFIWFDEKKMVDKTWNFHYWKVIPQMYKFHIFQHIPNLHDNVLVVDSDLYWLQPRTMLSCNGTVSFHLLHTKGKLNEKPFVTTFGGLNLTKEENIRAIAHHMLLQRDVMKDLFETVKRNTNSTTFAQALSKWRFGRISEWALYYAFVRTNYPERIQRDFLPMVTVGNISKTIKDKKLNEIEHDIVFLSCHDHALGSNRFDCYQSKMCQFLNKKEERIS